MGAVVAHKQSWEFAPGHEIAPGRTVLEPIGGGRRYEVYRVWDERRYEAMVAKIVRPDLVADERSLRGLRREAQALDALAHPAILRGFGAQLKGPYPHVLVEHLDGPTLRALIRRRGPLPAEQAAPVGVHVAAAIHYMAAEGWVHLDLKPANIVMGAIPRVIDLSLARTLRRAARLRGRVGTNAYMSPEQCIPGGDIGPAADVWGLGATLYHAAAGTRPFSKPRSSDAAAPLAARFPQLTEAPRPWPVRVPEPLSGAILACLQEDPAKRPAAAELADLLR